MAVRVDGGVKRTAYISQLGLKLEKAGMIGGVVSLFNGSVKCEMNAEKWEHVFMACADDYQSCLSGPTTVVFYFYVTEKDFIDFCA